MKKLSLCVFGGVIFLTSCALDDKMMESNAPVFTSNVSLSLENRDSHRDTWEKFMDDCAQVMLEKLAAKVLETPMSRSQFGQLGELLTPERITEVSLFSIPSYSILLNDFRTATPATDFRSIARLDTTQFSYYVMHNNQIVGNFSVKYDDHKLSFGGISLGDRKELSRDVVDSIVCSFIDQKAELFNLRYQYTDLLASGGYGGMLCAYQAGKYSSIGYTVQDAFSVFAADVNALHQAEQEIQARKNSTIRNTTSQ